MLLILFQSVTTASPRRPHPQAPSTICSGPTPSLPRCLWISGSSISRTPLPLLVLLSLRTLLPCSPSQGHSLQHLRQAGLSVLVTPLLWTFPSWFLETLSVDSCHEMIHVTFESWFFQGTQTHRLRSFLQLVGKRTLTGWPSPGPSPPV